MNLTLTCGGSRAPTPPGKLRALRGARHQPGHVVPRDARRRQRADWSRAGRCRSRSITTAAKGSAGSCGMMINGVAHGPMKGTATCQLHMRSFQDGATIYIEPWRSRAFPVIKDLVVDRSALDRIIAAGGFITAPTGGAQDANNVPGCRSRTPMPRWTRPRASAAARASRRARTARRRCSPRRRSRTSACCRRASRSAIGARGDGRADGRRGVRPLHAVRRVSGSVSQRDQHRHDRADESRLLARDAHRTRREERSPLTGVLCDRTKSTNSPRCGWRTTADSDRSCRSWSARRV